MAQSKKRRSKKTTNLWHGGLPEQLLAGIASGVFAVAHVTAQTVAAGSPLKSQRRWFYNLSDNLDTSAQADFEQIFADARKRKQITTALDRLQRRRLVKVVRRGGKDVLVITEEGKRKLLPGSFANTHTMKRPQQWDKKWRVVLYDIPELQRSGRDVLRERLQSLGFFQLQHSAFVFPFPCVDVVDALVHFHKLDSYVTVFVAESLGSQEAKALEHFGLLGD